VPLLRERFVVPWSIFVLMKTLAEYAKNLIKDVLLVEDDELLAELLINASKSYRCHVFWAKTCQEAINQLAQREFHVVLLDMKLPDGSGLDVFREMRANKIMTPVSIVSGYIDEKLIDAVRKIDFAVMIRKPSDFSPESIGSIFDVFSIKLAQEPSSNTGLHAGRESVSA